MTLGMSPDQHSPRHLHDAADVLELRREYRLQQVMPALNDLLADDSSSGRHLLVLTDARGEILWRVGSPEVLRRAGTGWSSPKGRTGPRPGSARTTSARRCSPAGRCSCFPPSIWSAPTMSGPARRRPSRTRPRASCWVCSTSPTAGHPQRGHAADGAVRRSGGGVAFGNARRRDVRECPTCPGRFPADRPPPGCGR